MAWKVLVGFGLLLVVIGLLYLRKPLARLQPEFDVSKLDVPVTAVSTELLLPLKVKNVASRPIRLVGSDGAYCGPGGCFLEIDPIFCEIAPGQTEVVNVRFKSPNEPGKIDCEFLIYLACDYAEEFRFRITGQAVSDAVPKEDDLGAAQH